jgi:hypothetical protein
LMLEHELIPTAASGQTIASICRIAWVMWNFGWATCLDGAISRGSASEPDVSIDADPFCRAVGTNYRNALTLPGKSVRSRSILRARYQHGFDVEITCFEKGPFSSSGPVRATKLACPLAVA